jgi:hypothetical protein
VSFYHAWLPSQFNRCTGLLKNDRGGDLGKCWQLQLGDFGSDHRIPHSSFPTLCLKHFGEKDGTTMVT